MVKLRTSEDRRIMGKGRSESHVSALNCSIITSRSSCSVTTNTFHWSCIFTSLCIFPLLHCPGILLYSRLGISSYMSEAYLRMLSRVAHIYILAKSHRMLVALLKVAYLLTDPHTADIHRVHYISRLLNLDIEADVPTQQSLPRSTPPLSPPLSPPHPNLPNTTSQHCPQHNPQPSPIHLKLKRATTCNTQTPSPSPYTHLGPIIPSQN